MQYLYYFLFKILQNFGGVFENTIKFTCFKFKQSYLKYADPFSYFQLETVYSSLLELEKISQTTDLRDQRAPESYIP